MPICERFDVDVDGRVESNRPAVWECLREWPLPLLVALEGGRVRGDVFRGRSWLAATERAARAAAVLTEMTGVGREKLWRLLVLELAWDVKLAKMGVPEVDAEGFWFWTLAFATFNGVESSLEEDSTLLTRGRDRSVEEALL